MALTRREILSIGSSLGASAWLAASGLAPALANAAPASANAPAAGDAITHVNPELIPALESRTPFRRLDAALLAQIRAAKPDPGPPMLASPPVHEELIPGPKGAPRVRVFVAGATAGGSKPAVLHIHGGGYVLGSAGAERRKLQELSLAQDCVVVSVDYRLAPETKFPGSLEDNYSALRWLFTNTKTLGIDPGRVAVKGESAGGGHAAALAIAARDRGEFHLCYQVLIYPMLDDRTGSAHQLPPYFGHYIWTPQMNRFGWSSLLGVPAGSRSVPPHSVPARVSSVAGLAPAFIGVGSIDLFCPEDVEYASRLMNSGISTELHVVPGAYHGFDLIAPAAAVSTEFTQTWNAALKRAFTTA